MKPLYSIIFLLAAAQPLMALSMPKTYPYHLNDDQVNSIIQQAVALGINKSTKINDFNSFSYSIDGEFAGVSLKFEPTILSPVLKEQHNLYCQPNSQNLTQISCKKQTNNYLKLNSNDEECIEFRNPYGFSYDELAEVITYANKIKPVNWQGNVTYLSVEKNYIIRTCFSSSSSYSYNHYKYPCLNIKRTTENGVNYFTVDWLATPK